MSNSRPSTVNSQQTADSNFQLDWKKIASYLILIPVTILVGLPFLWMLSSSVKSPAEIFIDPPRWIPNEFHFENFMLAWGKAPFAQFFFNSIIVTLSIVAIQLTTACLAAYAFARLKFPGKNLLFLLYLSVMMVPTQVTLIPNYVTLSRLSLLNTYAALILPFIATGFGTFLIRQQFLSIPQDLGDAARMDGAGHLRTLWHVYVPLARPAIASFGLLAAMWHWNDFFWPLITTTKVEMRTMPLGLQVFAQQEAGVEWHLLMAAAIFVAAPIIILFMLAQRQFIEGIASAGVKG
jgi:ABC-type glycerol-3-phosphate transport system permease component